MWHSAALQHISAPRAPSKSARPSSTPDRPPQPQCAPLKSLTLTLTLICGPRGARTRNDRFGACELVTRLLIAAVLQGGVSAAACTRGDLERCPLLWVATRGPLS